MVAVISRKDWGAKNADDPGGSDVSLGQRDAFMGHYSTGEELGRAHTAAWVREIQAFHMGPQRGWADIGYNFLIDIYGNIFEGRGWGKAGAHCPNWNTRAFGVCFLGDDDPGVNDVTPEAKRAFKELYQDAQIKTPKTLRIMGHRDGKSTTCPGDELYGWLKAGMPLPIPTPTPTPDKPLEDDMARLFLDPDGRHVWAVSGTNMHHVPNMTALNRGRRLGYYPKTQPVPLTQDDKDALVAQFKP